ncbi:hypothetical protein F5876DRAFT_70004 [Lentinula aff. lateritia]|uniref:Uncharacterized protein n=1 Tax=Lentinula aff. lateritia TaxID=2804960 RepID=A0ACC1TKH1_9AGAR|nr:hypothetical protein F5876DRAFT_70004 [Lentinula aff. lateritia]
MNGFKATRARTRNEMPTLNTLGKGKKAHRYGVYSRQILDICYLRKWSFSRFLQIPSKRNLKTTNTIVLLWSIWSEDRTMLSTSPEDSPGIDMSAIFAPFFWGFFVSIFLGGITIVQAYMYFPHPTDRKSVQVLAASMLILDLISSALVAQSLYHYLIPHFGSTAPLKTITPHFDFHVRLSLLDVSPSRLIDFIGSSQMYFVFQIHSVKRTGILAWTILGVLMNKIFFGLAKGFGAVTDIMATIAMCTYLSNAKTGFSTHTDSLIKGLIQYIIERGAVVTLIQTLLLITFFACPNNLYWLNARKNLWKKHAPKNDSAFSSSDIEIRSTRIEGSGKSYALSSLQSRDQRGPAEMPMITKSVVIADV